MNPQNQTSMNLLGVMKPVSKEPKGAQMTIFYAGQVFVFDDFSADRAKEIMSLATKGKNSESQNNYPNMGIQRHPSFPASSSRPFPFHVNNIMPSTASNLVQEQSQAPPTPIVVDLPMTRKASLYRFLEKRKDRIAARAPYQASSPMATAKKTADDSMSWLGLAPKSPQDKSESSSSSVLF